MQAFGSEWEGAREYLSDASSEQRAEKKKTQNAEKKKVSGRCAWEGKWSGLSF